MSGHAHDCMCGCQECAVTSRNDTGPDAPQSGPRVDPHGSEVEEFLAELRAALVVLPKEDGGHEFATALKRPRRGWEATAGDWQRWREHFRWAGQLRGKLTKKARRSRVRLDHLVDAVLAVVDEQDARRRTIAAALAAGEEYAQIANRLGNARGALGDALRRTRSP